MTETQIKYKIDTEDEYSVGCLISLYRCQMAGELAYKTTIEKNGSGFSAYDTEILTSISEQFLRHGTISPKQLAFTKTKIKKYWKQLQKLNPKPLKIVKPKPKPEANKITKPILNADLHKDSKYFSLRFAYPQGDRNFRAMVDFVKTLPGKSWQPKTKDWKVMLSTNSVLKVMNAGFVLSSELKAWYSSMSYEAINTDIEVHGLTLDLYPFQKESLAFIESRKGRALVGDDMGLGKTFQSIAWLQLNKDKNALPAIVLCPAGVKLNWEKEIHKIAPGFSVCVVNGRWTEGMHIHSKRDIYIMNYDIVAGKKIVSEKTQKVIGTQPAWDQYFVDKIQPKTLIMDEIHKIKNQKAGRTMGTIKLAKACKNKIGLSGTPITNRPSEFFVGLNLIAPEIFPNYWEFAQKYCGATHNGFGWDFSGSSNTEELHRVLTDTIMIRHTKKEVFKDMPEKTRSIIPIQINNKPEYDDMDSKLDSDLAKIEIMKQLALEGKMESVFKWVDDFLESDEKLVIMGIHHTAVDALMDRYKKIAVRFTGRDSQAGKQKALDKFMKNRDCRLFVGNLQAAGTGVDGLQRVCSNMAIIEFGWESGTLLQGEDRLNRIGQDSPVNIYYLVANETIEEDIISLLNQKYKVLGQILDGKSVDDSEDLIKLLLKKMKEK